MSTHGSWPTLREVLLKSGMRSKADISELLLVGQTKAVSNQIVACEVRVADVRSRSRKIGLSLRVDLGVLSTAFS